MSWLSQAESPADRSPRRWAFDAAVALFAGVAAIPSLYRDQAHPSPLAAPVLLIVVAPLVLRRIYPLPVLAWLLIATAATTAWDHQAIPGFALIVALFTVASMLPRRYALGSAGVLELIVMAVAIHQNGSNFWYDAIFLSGLIGAALGLGLYTGTRRAYLAELQDRAARLERERDQQGALAAAAERARISREMHDIIAHHLTVMVALSDGAIAATASSPQQGIEVMRTVSATGRRALADTRRLLGMLGRGLDEDPSDALRPLPGLAELDALLDGVRAAGLPTEFRVQGSAPDVAAGVQLTAYRIVQEALTNTLKHGGGEASASVQLIYRPGELAIDVIDDGIGGSTPLLEGSGRGLSGMRERVGSYGGQITAGPARPAGWRVSARLRLDEVEA